MVLATREKTAARFRLISQEPHMRTHATVLIVGLVVLLAGTAANADPIYMKTGDSDAGLSNQFTGVSWVQTTEWTDVEVSLDLYNFAPVGVTAGATVYLLDSIGPGTTQAANEIASAVITSNTPGAQTVTPFAGLTLDPGTYYLAYLLGAGALADPDALLAWAVNLSGTATTTTAPGVTALDGFRNSAELPAYAPEVATVAMSDTADLLFAITGTPAAIPEPATLALMLGGAAGLAFRTRRRNRM
jgi:hypothetical protein